MKEVKPILSVFFHNYYGSDTDWLNLLCTEITEPFHLFFNTVSGSYNRLSQSPGWNDIVEATRSTSVVQMHLRESPNKGRDIGGKMVLMDAYLRSGVRSDYILFFHDKQSRYHHNSQSWTGDLIRIIRKEYLLKAFEIFESNPKVGMIASGNAIRNEVDNDQNSTAYIDSTLIMQLKNTYNIQPADLRYVAGTIFLVRARVYEEFFTLHPPLQIRSTLESGNFTDHKGPTITHSWERLLSWIVSSNGYLIQGI